MKAKQLIALALITVASAATLPAQAADRDFSERIFAAVSDTIATQGNQALRDIRKELRKNLVAAIKPLLPEPTDTAEGGASLDSGARAVQ